MSYGVGVGVVGALPVSSVSRRRVMGNWLGVRACPSVAEIYRGEGG